MLPRVFLDTNIWFSALYGSESCQLLIQAHINKTFIAVITSEVLIEIARNLKKKIPAAMEVFEQIMALNPPELYPDPINGDKKIKNFVHPKDWPIFSGAIETKVDYFITGNLKDFNIEKLEKITKIKIITPNEAVKLFKLI